MLISKSCRMLLSLAATGAMAQAAWAGCNCSVPPSPMVSGGAVAPWGGGATYGGYSGYGTGYNGGYGAAYNGGYGAGYSGLPNGAGTYGAVPYGAQPYYNSPGSPYSTAYGTSL